MTEPIDNTDDLPEEDRPLNEDGPAGETGDEAQAPEALPPDLTDDWPEDADKAHLTMLASDLLRRRAHLSPAAIHRIHATMLEEMDLRHGGRFSGGGFGPGGSLSRWIQYGTLLALLISLIVIGIFAMTYVRRVADDRQRLLNQPATSQAVHDTYILPVAGPGTADILPTLDPQAVAQEMACWKMLPVKPDQLVLFRSRLDALASGNPRSQWLGVYRLYVLLLDMDGNVPADQKASAPPSAMALASAADAVKPPAQFPTIAADARLFSTLHDQWFNDNACALQVIDERSWTPLAGLADLDDRLTHTADDPMAQGEASKKLLACRDRLRNGYLAIARHYRERDMALKLLGRDADAAALENNAAKIPALSGGQALRDAVNQLDPKSAWEQILRPMLNGDLVLLEPRRPSASPSTSANEQMTITAVTRIVEGAQMGYKDDVEVTLGSLHMRCDRLSINSTPDGSQLIGRGNVSVAGVAGFTDTITASAFSFDTVSGLFSFTGNVHLSPTRVLKTCTITRGGVVFLEPPPATTRAAP